MFCECSVPAMLQNKHSVAKEQNFKALWRAIAMQLNDVIDAIVMKAAQSLW